MSHLKLGYTCRQARLEAFDRFCARQTKRLRLQLDLDNPDLEDARDMDLTHYSLPPGDGMERVHMEHETVCEVRR